MLLHFFVFLDNFSILFFLFSNQFYQCNFLLILIFHFIHVILFWTRYPFLLVLLIIFASDFVFTSINISFFLFSFRLFLCYFLLCFPSFMIKVFYSSMIFFYRFTLDSVQSSFISTSHISFNFLTSNFQSNFASAPLGSLLFHFVVAMFKFVFITLISVWSALSYCCFSRLRSVTCVICNCRSENLLIGVEASLSYCLWSVFLYLLLLWNSVVDFTPNTKILRNFYQSSSLVLSSLASPAECVSQLFGKR